MNVLEASLCLPIVRELGVSGASISVSSDPKRQSTVCASDPVAARIDALQLELGEGPRWTALSSRAPALCADLRGQGHTQWPVFTEAVGHLDVRAVFSFPMIMGAAVVGVVDVYCRNPRPVDPHFLSLASLLAGRAASGAVQIALQSAERETSQESSMAPAMRREVHQATGVLISQLRVSATEAFARLRGHAFVTNQSIEEVAHEIVERRLRLDDLPH